MKEFMMKHPIISLLMVSEICGMVTCICKGKYMTPMASRVLDTAAKTENELQEKISNLKDRKDPVGFKVQ